MIRVSLKSSALTKAPLICECDDPEISFLGDIGAIGRLTSTQSQVLVDLKGRQYSGTLTAGPTIMIINPNSMGPTTEQYKVEAITNEYCHLTFERDQFGSLGGRHIVGTGSDDEDDERDIMDDFEFSGKSESTKKRSKTKRKKDEESSSENSYSDSDRSDSRRSRPKKEKKNVKISTITQRKRTSSAKKKKSKAK